MRRRQAIVLLALAALSGMAGFAWWRRTRPPSPVNAAEFENAITAGLVRGILRELAAKNPPTVCFLAFGEGRTPASPGFVAQFRGTRPVVRSADSSVAPPVGRHLELSSGRPGLLLRVVRLRPVSPSVWEAAVAFSHQPEGRDRFLYRVTRLGDEWVITSREPE